MTRWPCTCRCRPRPRPRPAILMLSSNNILKPADGRPVTMPTQDMIIGLFHLTSADKLDARAGAGRGPGVLLGRRGDHGLRRQASSTCGARIKIRLVDVVPPARLRAARGLEPGRRPGPELTLETTLGRALFNETLPGGLRRSSTSRSTRSASARSSTTWPSATRRSQVAATLDALKEAGFHWATRSGTTVVHRGRRRTAAARARSSRATRPRRPRSRASTSAV